MSRKKYPPLPITAEQRVILQNAPNVYLIGLMGAGKSTVGRILAQALQRDFVDSDDEIIARTGTTIGTIFEIEGEAGFREREARVIADLTKRHDLVLATGGGAVLRTENREHRFCKTMTHWPHSDRCTTFVTPFTTSWQTSRSPQAQVKSVKSPCKSSKH